MADFETIETRQLAVVGKAREGKSTLLDQVIEQMNDNPVWVDNHMLQVVAGETIVNHRSLYGLLQQFACRSRHAGLRSRV